MCLLIVGLFFLNMIKDVVTAVISLANRAYPFKTDMSVQYIVSIVIMIAENSSKFRITVCFTGIVVQAFAYLVFKSLITVFDGFNFPADRLISLHVIQEAPDHKFITIWE